MPRLHEQGAITPDDRVCTQEHKADWRYCPACGTVLTSVVFPRELQTSLDHAESDAIEVRYAAEGNLENAVTVRVNEELGGTDPRVRAEVLRRTGASGTIKIQVPASASDASYRIVLEADDGPRDPAHPFRERSGRRIEVGLVVRRGRSEAAVYPEYLPVGRKLPTRPFRVVNRGTSPLVVGQVEATDGFAVDPPERARDFPLAPGEERELSVRRVLETARRGRVRVLGRDAEELASARVDWLLPGRPTMPPYSFVVGVDFGTSNTSVFARNVQRGANPPVPLPDEARQRFPTLVYVKGARETDWAIGPEAQNRYDADPTGYLIPDLKTAIRNQSDANANATKKALKFYLERLLRQYIEPYLAVVNPDELPVCFVFSLPVLDAAEEEPDAFERYRKAVLDAAVAAGYLEFDHWKVDTILEPDAAALEILLSEPGERAFQDGDVILIVDSGGGTTDLCLATITIEDDEVGLENIRNGAVVVGSEDDDVNQRQFGGNRVNRELYRLLTADGELAYDWTADQDRQKDDPKAIEIDLQKAMLRPIENVKIKLDQTTEESVDVYGSRTTKRQYTLDSADVDQVFEALGPQITGSIEDFLSREGVAKTQIRSVYAVGGNNRLEAMTRLLTDQFGRAKVVLLPAERRGVAVPRGIVYRFSNRVRTLDLDVQITVPRGRSSDAGDRLSLCLSGQAVGSGAVRRQFLLGAGERTYVDVRAQIPLEEPLLIDRIPVVSEEETLVIVTTELRDGVLRVKVTGEGVQAPAFPDFVLEPTR